MRPLLRVAVSLTAFFAVASAFTFSSPTSGSSIDLTQPFSISWSVSYTDPSTIDLKLSSSDSDSEITLASGVVSYTGQYTVSPGTIKSSGSGYTLVAVGNGNTLAQLTGLSLGGTGGQTSTVAEATLTSTQTIVPVASTGTGAAGATSSTVPTASIDSVGATTLPGTVSGSQVLASIAHTGSSFVTSTTSKGSASSSAATATAGSTNTASGQKRLSGELVLGAAGVLAGVVALLA